VTVTSRGAGGVVTQTNIVYSTTRVSGTVWVVYVAAPLPPARSGPGTNAAAPGKQRPAPSRTRRAPRLAGGRAGGSAPEGPARALWISCRRLRTPTRQPLYPPPPLRLHHPPTYRVHPATGGTGDGEASGSGSAAETGLGRPVLRSRNRWAASACGTSSPVSIRPDGPCLNAVTCIACRVKRRRFLVDGPLYGSPPLVSRVYSPRTQ